MSKPRSLKRAGKPRKRPDQAGVRWLVIVLVLVAVLIILLRMAEFSGHRMHRGPRRILPALLLPQNARFHAVFIGFVDRKWVVDSTNIAKAGAAVYRAGRSIAHTNGFP